jgi:ribosomal protein L13
MSEEGEEQAGYLGAILEEENRLVLVPLDPDRPWAAFRRMRSWMKRSRERTTSVDVFTAPEASEDAQVIELRRPPEDRG